MAKVKPVPEGFHTLTPHLVCKGAGEAFEFYKKAFGATGIMCMPGPDGKGVMHAEMRIGDSVLFLADEYPQAGCSAPPTIGGTAVVLHLYMDNVDAAFDRAVSAGCKVRMPPMNMFWGDRYAKVTDPFGHEWSLAQHIEDVPPEEMGKRAAEAMKQYAAQGKGCS
jgi:uncharacterized glyoxalase superfamily protein PhnB